MRWQGAGVTGQKCSCAPRRCHIGAVGVSTERVPGEMVGGFAGQIHIAEGQQRRQPRVTPGGDESRAGPK